MSTPNLAALSENERRLLAFLLKTSPAEVPAAAEGTGMQPVQVRSAASWLASKGFVEVEEDAARTLRLAPEGAR
jgi:predicted transcriptional regulator